MSTANERITELADEADRITLNLLDRLDRLAGTALPGGVSHASYKFLREIETNGSMRIESAPNTTAEKVARLVKDGLITRTPCPRDARSAVAELTDRGRQLVQRCSARVHDEYQMLVNRMPPADREACLEALLKLDTLLRGGGEAREAAPTGDAAPAGKAALRPADSDTRKAQRVRVFSVKQVAKMCLVSYETIRRWIRKYGLPAYNTTGGLAIKITETDLREFSERLKVYVEWERVDEGE